MLLRFVGLAEHFGQMLDGADEIVFFAQTAVEFHVERADRLEEPGNWIALIELFRNAAHFGDDDRRKIDLGFFVEPGLAPVALARDRAGCIDEAPGDSAVFVDEGRKEDMARDRFFGAFRQEKMIKDGENGRAQGRERVWQYV